MNWYLLNLPLCVAIATGVVAPIIVVVLREPTGTEAAAGPTAGSDGLVLVPAGATSDVVSAPAARSRVLQSTP